MASALAQAKQLANYNNQLEQSNVKQQYNYNKLLAEQDRSWQERMANSAHQREIKDLKTAGLNPVLSITGGNGASTPTGSSASVSKADTDMSLPSKVMDMAIAQLNSATALQQTMMQAANGLAVAQTQAGAAMYSADKSYDGTVYSSDKGFEGTKYTVDTPSANTVAGLILNSPKFVKKFAKKFEASMPKKTKQTVKNLQKLNNTKAKYIVEYEAAKKSGKRLSKADTKYYNQCKRELARLGLKPTKKGKAVPK